VVLVLIPCFSRQLANLRVKTSVPLPPRITGNHTTGSAEDWDIHRTDLLVVEKYFYPRLRDHRNPRHPEEGAAAALRTNSKFAEILGQEKPDEWIIALLESFLLREVFLSR